MSRVIAYFMHEAEEGAALNSMSNVQRTESFVIGDIDAGKIEALRSQGLIVDEVREAPSRSLEGLSEVLTTLSNETWAGLPPPDLDPAVTYMHTVTLDGPLLEDWRQQLQALGVTLTEAIGPRRYLCVLQPDQKAQVLNLPFVVDVSPRTELDTAPPIPSTLAPPVRRFPPIVTYDIRLRSSNDAPALVDRLASRNVVVAGSQGRKVRIALAENSPVLAELRGMIEVVDILEYVPPRLYNDRSRVLLGIDAPAAVAPFPYDGSGQIVGVADTGIDENHPDFGARLVGVEALGRMNDPSDPNGHGTHVAGSIAGDGTASNGAVRGMAPAASLFFQSVLDARGELGGLPWDLNDLFEPAYQAGVRIHNNSWGASTASRYAFNSLEVDEFVGKNRDMAIVIAAGNEGSARQPFSAKPGFVDWLSVGSPATSKNAITVGASRTDRTTGGFSAMTWGQVWPNDFPDVPISGETVSGDAESMAGFSSRGPCDDRRIKPDVVAPGTDIASTKSSRAPLANFWGSYPGHAGRYAYMGGTSMATPIVSGCLALIRQYYVDARQHEPSAALLKATLVNSTRRLSGASATADHDVLPNFHQGFGCVHMPFAIPNPAEPGLKLEYIDSWKDAALQFTVTGQRFRFRIDVGSGRPLRICLAYTDLPARALQNNLNLFVQSPDSSKKWTGNENLPMRLSAIDKDNNVEIVRIETPAAGKYLIQLAAENLLSTSPQDFALVITGDLNGSIQNVP